MTTTKKIREQLKDQTAGYMTAALGLVAGLAWNDAIKSLIEALFPFAKSGVFAKFFYAVIITIVVVFISRSILGPPTVEVVQKNNLKDDSDISSKTKPRA